MEQKNYGSLAQGLISVVAILAIAIAAVVGVSILAGQNPGFIFSEILNRLQSQTPDGTSQSSGESNNPEILGVYCFF